MYTTFNIYMGAGAQIREMFVGCQPQFPSKENFLKAKFADKEDFPRIPTSASTQGWRQEFSDGKG